MIIIESGIVLVLALACYFIGYSTGKAEEQIKQLEKESEKVHVKS
jgi:hypothetical protein